MRDDTATHLEEPPFPDEPRPTDNVTPLRETSFTNRSAETALIGALLLEPQRAPLLEDQLDPSDFHDPRHEQIWNAIYTVLHEQGVIPDAILVTNHLAKTGQLNRIGGGYLPDLITSCPTPANATHYAQQVRETGLLRRIDSVGTRVKALAANSTPENASIALADALQDLDDAVTKVGSHGQSSVTYVPFDGLFTRPRTPIQWVISPILAAGRVSLLYSPGKTGKSLIAIEAAAAVATGRPAMATTTNTDPQHVLYIDQEMTEDDWIDRLTDMGYDTTDEHTLAEHLHLAQLQTWPPMDTAAGGRAVEAAAKHTQATVVIIDTASKVIAGEENSNDTQQAFYRHTLIPLKRAGIAVLVLDHTGKDLDRGARGGSAKTDNIDLAFELLKRGKDLLTLRCTHARVRDHLLEEPVFLRRTTGPLAHTIETRHTGTQAGPGVRPTHLMQKVSRYVEANPGTSKMAIETAVSGRREYVRLALEILVTEAFIRTESGPKNSTTHHQVTRYSEDEDNQ